MFARIKTVSRWIPLTAIVLWVVAFSNSLASASILVPGSGPTATPGTATLSGLTPVATETVPYASGSNTYAGDLISTVYLDSGTGDYDFGYQDVAFSGGTYTDAIHTITVDSYTNGAGYFTTDVDYVTDAGEIPYATASRPAFGPGDEISLDFVGGSLEGIAPGDTSDLILVKTNAANYDPWGLTNFIDDTGATINTYEPAPGVVPEPASAAIAAFGFCALALRRRKNKA